MFSLRLAFQQPYACYIWRFYEGVMAIRARGGQTIEKCELPTRAQHNISSYLVMVSTLIFSTSFGTN